MKFPRLLRHTTLLLPTPAGWILFFGLVLLGSATVLHTVHPFLAPSKPVSGEILVVEGWVPDYCLEHAAHLFKEGSYQMLVCTGGPLEQGSYLKDYQTYAQLAAATVIAAGVPESLVVAVGSSWSKKDRTFRSALSLKNWLDSTGISLERIDLCSHDVHARRSALLFKKALGSAFQVGIIAMENRDYDWRRWWTSSEGVRCVMGETIAYLYARFVFRDRSID